jgi:hypothetical protein
MDGPSASAAEPALDAFVMQPLGDFDSALDAGTAWLSHGRRSYPSGVLLK